MKAFKIGFLLAVVCAGVILGCSGSGASDNPLIPGGETGITGSSENSKHSQMHLWGYYDVYVDIPTQTITAVPNRQAMFTVNAVKFLNEKAESLVWTINSIEIASDYFDADVDISLTHPFPGMPQYNGYDVRGVFMGDGSASPAYNSDLIYPVHGNDQFMMTDPVDGYGGPDGYTRWFNAPEFSTGEMPLVEYTPGAMATPDYNSNATLNAYKYFADGLGATDNLWDYLNDNSAQHGLFSSGATNTRNYYLRFPNSKGNAFSYAVVANWEGLEPEYHPSNAPEAVACNVIDNSDLWYGGPTLNGGSIKLDISLWDWDSTVSGGVMEDYKIFIESTVLTSAYELTTSEMTPIGGSETFSTYHVEIPADNVPGVDGNEYWVIVEQSGYDYNNPFGVPNLAGSDPLAAFSRYDLSVSTEIPAWIIVTSPNGGEEWQAGTFQNITWTSQAVIGSLSIEYSKDNFVSDIHEIIASTINDGVYNWKVPDDPSTTVRVRITDTSAPSVYDISDNDFTILEKPTLTVLVPNGGEVWDVDSTYDITWESTGDIANVKIGYSKDDFVSDVHEITASTENTGVFQWTVPNDPSSTVKIGIVDTSIMSVYDVSDDNFTIKGAKPTITVLSPNGGESWQVSSNHDITWETTGDIAALKIEYSKDNFASDINEIIASTENDGVFQWHIPNDPSSTVQVRITDTSDATIFDISDNDFTIEDKPTLTVISPNGGEVLLVDSHYNITWESDGEITAVKIGYSKDNFVSDINEITASTENDGVFQWEVPNDPSSTVKIAIVDTTTPSIYDMSDNNFTIKSESVETSLYWNQFMHDSSHGGLTGVNGPQTCNYVWSHEAGNMFNTSSIVEGFDGTLYFGDEGVDLTGRIWAVNPDGSTKWVNSLPGFGVWPSPLGVTADNSVLYVGIDEWWDSGDPFKGRIVGIDTSNGNELWSYDAWDYHGWAYGTEFGLVLDSSDLVVLVHQGIEDWGPSSIIRLDQYGSVKWSRDLAFNWWSAPAQGLDGTIYVNVQPFLGLPKILALDPDTGATVGEFHYDYEYDPEPFFNTETNVAVRSDGKIIFGAGDMGFCLNPDMTLDWSLKCPTGVLMGGIGVGPNDEVYVHDEYHLFAISPTGTPLWAEPYSSWWMSPAIGADGIIYIGTESSGLVALDPSNGDLIWSYSDFIVSSPIIAHDGSLYVVLDFKLAKFGA